MSIIFKIFILRQNENRNKQKYFLFLKGARQGLTLLLRISIRA